MANPHLQSAVLPGEEEVWERSCDFLEQALGYYNSAVDDSDLFSHQRSRAFQALAGLVGALAVFLDGYGERERWVRTRFSEPVADAVLDHLALLDDLTAPVLDYVDDAAAPALRVIEGGRSTAAAMNRGSDGSLAPTPTLRLIHGARRV
jgi:hypothetical protein